MCLLCSFFFNDTATTEIYTLSLHDALPILTGPSLDHLLDKMDGVLRKVSPLALSADLSCSFTGRLRLLNRSEEHTSELQSRQYLVCRLLLEKKKQTLGIVVTLSISARHYVL